MEPNSIHATTSNIDLSILSETIKILPTLLGSAAALIASIAAIRGINAWKREFQGKKKIELAEESLTLFYQARDAIRRIRNPLGNSDEGRSKIPEHEKTDFSGKTVPHVYVILERFEKEEHIFNKISAMRYRFMAVFGNKSESPFESIRKIINDIFLAARMYGMRIDLMQEARNNEESLQKARDESMKNMKTIWYMGEDDIIEAQIKIATEELETICRPVILES